MTNIILMADSYKYSQFNQYPNNTTHISSYITARKGSVLFFGLQMFIKKYLLTRITREMIDEAEEIITAHGEPFNRVGWEYIVEEHKGRLPIIIQALPEGMLVPEQVPQVQITNTDPNCYWLVSFLETILLQGVWYPSSVATYSFNCKRVKKQFLLKTADTLDSLPFSLHDFGYRGVSSNESAGIGGLAHLVNFMGTDTVAALVAARRYYGEPMAGFSIPAMEHSTVTSWGRENETDSYRNQIKNYGGEGKIYAAVLDSYDVRNAARNIIGSELKKLIIEKGGTFVGRPDSGDPTLEPLLMVQDFDATFGSTINSRGYKVLNNVRVIQGDGVELETIYAGLEKLEQNGYSTENLAHGMGGQLLQKVNRDTYSYAMKASAIQIAGHDWVGIAKDPVGDKGKKSMAGRFAVTTRRDTGGLIFLSESELNGRQNLLDTVYLNGVLLKDQSLAEIRVRANSYL